MRQVLPLPPSPTTTNFFEYAGGTVTSVAADSAAVDRLMVELIVPLLPCELDGRTGFLRISEFCRDMRDEPLRLRWS